MQPLLKVSNLKVHFRLANTWFRKKRLLKAVDGISFELSEGEILGIVGESGCGKSTLARAILRLIEPTDGSVVFIGENLSEMDKKRLRQTRQKMQMIFQDPLSSLDPRMTVGEIIAEPLEAFHASVGKATNRVRVQSMMERVGLLPNQINRYPHEFSGGQCQRIGIARALILEPKLIVCDEPVSGLDVSIRAQIVNLLMELQSSMDLALIFIAHDLNIVKHISDRILAMYAGKIVEMNAAEALYDNPLHPYTQELIDSILIPDPAMVRKPSQFQSGAVVSALNVSAGCAFRLRCPIATDRCVEETPVLRNVGHGSVRVACHHVG